MQILFHVKKVLIVRLTVFDRDFKFWCLRRLAVEYNRRSFDQIFYNMQS